uniref:Uncharacterized protein n=1 Tax=Parascaris univalens TaxID=6257 RepID=A0A914ZL36_PARUN
YQVLKFFQLRQQSLCGGTLRLSVTYFHSFACCLRKRPGFRDHRVSRRQSPTWRGKSLFQNISRVRTCSPMLTSCALTFVYLVMLSSNTQALTFFVGTTGIDSETDAQLISVPKKSELTDDELSSAYDFCRLLPFMGHKVKVTSESKEICSRLIELLKPVFEGKSHSSKKQFKKRLSYPIRQNHGHEYNDMQY